MQLLIVVGCLIVAAISLMTASVFTHRKLKREFANGSTELPHAPAASSVSAADKAPDPERHDELPNI